MGFITKVARPFFVLIAFLSTPVVADIDYAAIEKDLTGKGLEGWVHGSSEKMNQFVLTYRTPGNFFEHTEFPLVGESPDKLDLLKKLVRHDHVRVRGTFITNGAPIKHISVKEIDVLEKFSAPEGVKEYHYQAEIPKDLEGKDELIAKVHAVAAEGAVLVVEYKDAVIPIPVMKPELTKNLFRNDKLKIKYFIKKRPGSPTHIGLNPLVKDPITVLESVVQLHGKPAELEGELVMFPKSPQVIFNVFALHQTDADGVDREYTLINFDDPDLFKALREKLQKAWDAQPEGVVNARNKLINTGVRIRAKGTFNVVDPGQANTQILLSTLDSITVL